HHRDLAPPRLLARQLGHLRAHLGGHHPVHRHHRPVLHAVPAVPEVHPGGGGAGDQGAAPRGRARGARRCRRPRSRADSWGGALTGMLLAYSMMYFMNVVDFPINIANRPPHSPPAFIPITFELAVLLGGSSAFLGSLFLLFRFPQPYHPLFESENFRRASID